MSRKLRSGRASVQILEAIDEINMALNARSLARTHAATIIGAIQALFTTGFATAIACARTAPLGEFSHKWLPAWLLAYVMALPIVMLIAPFLRRLAAWLAALDGPARP